MPKYLFLCRHADTLERVASQTDYERNLSPLGFEEAQKAATWIKKFNLPVDYMICSAAVRTTETAFILAQNLAVPTTQVIRDPELYNIKTPDLLHKLSQLSLESQVALVVGHNPVISEAVSSLNQQQRLYVPTGGVNFFTFNTSEWQEIAWSTYTLKTNY